MKNVSLNPTEMRRIETFVAQLAAKKNARGETNVRDRRNNDTGAHRFGQNVVGKVGELAATKVVGGDVDFRVWMAGARGATFEADIFSTKQSPKRTTFANVTVHVKTTHAKYMNDASKVSWTIDKNDPLVEGGDGDEVIVLMFADETGRAAAFGWVYAADVANYWRATINLPHKLAIYYNDVKTLVTRF